ncbi:cytochrome P450 [Micromonospora sp. NPDC093277]|uniref:cytochrome P450 n=1 Tax=Micromonospora sp. NPDC093277 TaxID=3364291 RepID=UPI0038223702
MMTEDPYAWYAQMREQGPLVWHEATAAWYATGYRDVSRLLLDERLGGRNKEALLAGLPPVPRRVFTGVERHIGRWMIFADPPYQSRLHAAVAPLFRPAAVMAMSESFTDRAESLLGGMSQHGDLVADLARPFAVGCTGELLGITADEWPAMTRHSDDLIAYLTMGSLDLAVAERALATVEALHRYVVDVVLPRGNGPIAPILADRLADGTLDGGDVVAIWVQLLTGGIEPVGTVAAGVVAELLDGRNAMYLPQDDDAWVEEALRFHTPFHFAPRCAREAFSYGGCDVRQGDRVVLVLAGANRDPSVFAQPDEFRPGRNGRPNLAFSRGPHFCLGAVLARQQLRALVAVFRRRHADRWIPDGQYRIRHAFGGSAIEKATVRPAASAAVTTGER